MAIKLRQLYPCTGIKTPEAPYFYPWRTPMHKPSALTLSTFAVLATSSLLTPAVAKPSAPFFLSSKGPVASIVAYADLNTSNALIVGQIKFGDAQEYCDRDPGGNTTKYGGKQTFSQCVSQVLSNERGKKYYARANCSEGLVIDPSGDRYMLRQKKRDGAYWDSTWIDSKDGTALDGSNASGAPVITELYKALCPRK